MWPVWPLPISFRSGLNWIWTPYQSQQMPGHRSGLVYCRQMRASRKWTKAALVPSSVTVWERFKACQTGSQAAPLEPAPYDCGQERQTGSPSHPYLFMFAMSSYSDPSSGMRLQFFCCFILGFFLSTQKQWMDKEKWKGGSGHRKTQLCKKKSCKNV